jgi:hypothetical protein
MYTAIQESYSCTNIEYPYISGRNTIVDDVQVPTQFHILASTMSLTLIIPQSASMSELTTTNRKRVQR